MKHKGNTNCLAQMRTAEMAALCAQLIDRCKRIHMEHIYDQVVRSPSSRFWVTPHRASIVLSHIIKGDELPQNMHPLHREMYAEIHRRVSGIRLAHPSLTLLAACRIVVCQRAPKFYVTTGYAKICILKYRRRQRQHTHQWAKQKAETIKAALAGK